MIPTFVSEKLMCPSTINQFNMKRKTLVAGLLKNVDTLISNSKTIVYIAKIVAILAVKLKKQK